MEWWQVVLTILLLMGGAVGIVVLAALAATWAISKMTFRVMDELDRRDKVASEEIRARTRQG